ncbi:SulP family inorganic anion transporter [Roseomonas soli]|uniref:SulP family inorganic anion transporter n=2 Tax=Neoroseomonas soli TaxID=1081025 RepID=A0A9X9WV94_9PROT|nr:SulP family inorganic anion transporter [Neoroseomonas soli]
MPAWLRGYSPSWVGADLIAGVTLAAYAIPVALAYATLAGLPPQVGIYGYLLGGLGYALFGSSRHLAVGPTSAISLMVGANAAHVAGGDPAMHAAVASFAAFAAAGICLVSWAAHLSALVKLISDSVLVGFRFGAGLTIAMTQLPSLFGVAGGGSHVLERVWLLLGQLGGLNPVTLGLGLGAILLLVAGGRLLPGRPVSLGVVALSIAVVPLFGLAGHGVAVTGEIPAGLPQIGLPDLRIRDVPDLFPLAAGCVLLAYIEGVSAARGFAAKHGYEVNPRQELLGLGGANLLAGLGHGYPVAGGLSQSAVNEKAGAKSPLSLIFASATLALCLLFLTGALANLPKAVLAAVVLTAVAGLIDVPAMVRLWRISRFDFLAALCALAGVLLFGILQGVLLAALASVLMILVQGSTPYVAVLGRIAGTQMFSDRQRHPENEAIPGVVIVRPEAVVIYVGAEHAQARILAAVAAEPAGSLRHLVCDLSATPYMDVAGAEMLGRLHDTLAAQGIRLWLVGAHARLRDLLRNAGVADKAGGIERATSVESAIEAIEAQDA